MDRFNTKQKFVGLFVGLLMILAGLGISAVDAQDAQPNTGNYTWDSDAGPAPQTVQEAAKALGVSSDDAVFLTVLNGRAGDPTAIGWVLGSSATEQLGRTLTAEHVGKGLCVDLDPGATSLYGKFTYVDFTSQWRRAHMTDNGALRGLKATFYWTPCKFDGMATTDSDVAIPDGMSTIIGTSATKTVTTVTEGAKNTATGQPCLTLDNVAEKIGGDAQYWKELPATNHEGLLYGGTNGGASAVTFKYPGHGKVDGDGWTLSANGQTANGTKATYWCNGVA